LALVHYLESIAQDPKGTMARVKKFYEGKVRLVQDYEIHRLDACQFGFLTEREKAVGSP